MYFHSHPYLLRTSGSEGTVARRVLLLLSGKLHLESLSLFGFVEEVEVEEIFIFG